MAVSVLKTLGLIIFSATSIIIGKNASTIYKPIISQEATIPFAEDQAMPCAHIPCYDFERFPIPFSVTEIVRDTRICYLPQAQALPLPSYEVTVPKVNLKTLVDEANDNENKPSRRLRLAG